MDPSGGSSATLRYDPLGRLYEVVSGGSTTRFLYDGDELVAEYNAAGTLLRRYAHGKNVDDPMVWYEGTGTATPRFLHTDHQGSIVAVTNDTGAMLAINAYDEYGIPTASVAGLDQYGRFGYTGQAWISELGMYHYKARIYSPTLGRFLQTDPVGYDDQVNLYAYVGNDPINQSDPTGTTCTVTGGRTGSLLPVTARCKVDENAGGFTTTQIAKINSAYSKAVTKLLQNPNRKADIEIAGKKLSVTAGARGRDLVNTFVKTGRGQPRAITVGGVLAMCCRIGGMAVTTINYNAVEFDSSGTKANIDRDLERTFAHEAIHQSIYERIFLDVYRMQPDAFNRGKRSKYYHNDKYNDAAEELLGY